MSIENRPTPEGINVSRDHPLKEFLTLLAGLALIVTAIVVILSLLAEYMAPFIPFRIEQKLISNFDAEFLPDKEFSHADKQVQLYLTDLGRDLAEEMDLPSDMALNIHYSTDNTVNAFATLGGHIVIYKGLLRKLPHENALAMVVAHEIAHIKLRHPIIASGRGITVALALASLGGFAESNAISGLVNTIGLSSTLGFSRSQESDADFEAMNALLVYYGHVSGAQALFEVFANNPAAKSPAFFSTHPKSDQRIEQIKEFATKQAVSGSLTAIPTQVSQALSKSEPD